MMALSPPVALWKALLHGVLALLAVTWSAQAVAQERSTAHEPRVPSHVFDMIPGEPPAPQTPIVEYESEPGVFTVRRLLPTETVAPRVPDTWYDGETVTIRWDGPTFASQVRFYYYGEKCKLGGRSRGKFEGIINGGMVPNTGQLEWKVPWLDGPYLHLRMAAYDANEQRICASERAVRLLPRELKDLPPTCIAVSKRRQRLYYIEAGDIKRMHMVSTARGGYSTPQMKPGSYSRRRGALGKVFGKSYSPFSSLYHCHMPYWLGITSSGSHGIHATSPRFYGRLGRPASHGCIRQHRSDARKLYYMVDVGTPVYVF